jgi:outer membrane protein OmpA-like peptidoglycan-associated protein
MNLIELAKSYLTPDLVSKLAGQVGESQSGVNKAMDGILPSILGGMVSKVSTNEGANSLLGMFQGGGFDSNLLGNLSSMFGGGESSAQAMTSGKGVLDSLFGDKLGGIGSLISQFSGVKESSASSLMGLAAPMMMGVVGNQMNSSGGGGFNLSGLTSLLMSQKDVVAKYLPSGFAGVLGLGSLLGGFGQATENVKETVSTAINQGQAYTQKVASEAGGGLGKWIMPLILILAALTLAYFLFRSCSNTGGGGDGTKIDSTLTEIKEDTATKADEKPTTPESIKVKLADGTEIEAFKGSLEDELVKFIEDKSAAIDKAKWFDFAKTLQFETGKSAITPNSESDKQMNNILAILKAYPKLKIKIGGYTDNVGDSVANIKLSQSRAEAVMADLIKRGAKKEQITGAEGYGSQNPVASNDTEEGKAMNRRISISVREK